jgi:hypothetical protein
MVFRQIDLWRRSAARVKVYSWRIGIGSFFLPEGSGVVTGCRGGGGLYPRLVVGAWGGVPQIHISITVASYMLR